MPLKDIDKRREAHRKYMKEVWYPTNKKKHMQMVKIAEERGIKVVKVGWG